MPTFPVETLVNKEEERTILHLIFMKTSDFDDLIEDMRSAFAEHPNSSIGILGLTTVTFELLRALRENHLIGCLRGIFADEVAFAEGSKLGCPVHSYRDLKSIKCDVLIVASDSTKELIIHTALPFIDPSTKILIGGYGHFAYSDDVFTETLAQLLVPSLANGYPNTLVHIHQCLKSAAARKLNGIVVDFGMFKGGTTMLMAKLISRLGAPWKIIGFDSFEGFPPRRSPLDMYDHPGCVFKDFQAVKNYFEGENVEIIQGDIVQTAQRLKGKPIVLAFVDTDNFSPASAALDVIHDQIVAGGAIVFDHFTGVNRFRYTLGERIAAKRLLEDPRFFHLHGTGVFYRQS